MLARDCTDVLSIILSISCLTELRPVLHQCHIIASQMVHFVQQVQYYINFEVCLSLYIECPKPQLQSHQVAALCTDQPVYSPD